ncbi:MAG TPA: retropepsin-like aspartic protease [Thermodesulfobacteriota bacterium]|nr:retropepsin-like aspartic protease [Thermodesulfobacteriota bacterium]
MNRKSIFILLVFLLIPEAGFSDMFYWVDEQGIENYSGNMESIPERYRSRAQRLSLPPAPIAPLELAPSDPPKRPTRIPFSPGAPVLVQARINGIGPIPLILDTGADHTIISPSALARLGISGENVPSVTLKGVTGTASASRVWVDFIEIGEARVGPLLIAVYPADLKGAEGLLGRDFLFKFNMTIDSKERVVTLTPH